MSELEPQKQSDFMIEKIKERPINKKKLLRRTLLTASMAVIFGLIACFTFLVLEPVLSNWLHPEEAPQMVVFPEDREEMSPADMLEDSIHQEQDVQPDQGTVTMEKEQIEAMLSGVKFDLKNYRQMYEAMTDYVDELKPSMVTITGITSNVDWFNNVQESTKTSVGALIANNGKELLVVADYKPLKDADRLTGTFYGGTQLSLRLMDTDPVTELAVFAASMENISTEYLNSVLKIAPLGSTNLNNMSGTPVVAVGSPLGVSDSLGYGMISSSSSYMQSMDANIKLLQTDIVGSRNANGMLFNLNGELIGIITNYRKSYDMEKMITAYGISNLKKRIEKISNGEKLPYLGISGINVTRQAHDELNVPYGAYVNEIDIDSPAMHAGIQKGDIITKIDNRSIMSFDEYTSVLLQLDTGSEISLLVMRQVQNEYRSMDIKITIGELE